HLAKALHTCFEGRATSSPCQQRRGRQAATSASSVCHWDAQTRAPLPLQWSGSFTGTPATLRGSLDPAERALVSFLVEADIQALPVVKALVGVEVGLKDRAVFSSGEQVATPKHLRRGERRLAHAQRTLTRNQNGAKHRDETWHECPSPVCRPRVPRVPTHAVMACTSAS